jgi:hypothetical protein
VGTCLDSDGGKSYGYAAICIVTTVRTTLDIDEFLVAKAKSLAAAEALCRFPWKLTSQQT